MRIESFTGDGGLLRAFVMKALVFFSAFIVVFFVYVRYLERKGVFFPMKDMMFTPADFQMKYEDAWIPTGDGVKIHGWFVPKPGARSTLVFFHGNAGNISDRLGKVRMFHEVGLNVLIIDYRGYGKSEGTPTEQGIYRDALAAYEYLVDEKGVVPENIVSYGASLGGAVAVDLASKRKVGALIVNSSFTSAVDMAKKIYPFIPSFMIQIRLNSFDKIGNVKAPKLFFHSPQDEIVPYQLGRTLFEKAPPPKTFVDLRGGHNELDVDSQSLIAKSLATFLREHGLL